MSWSTRSTSSYRCDRARRGVERLERVDRDAEPVFVVDPGDGHARSLPAGCRQHGGHRRPALPGQRSLPSSTDDRDDRRMRTRPAVDPARRYPSGCRPAGTDSGGSPLSRRGFLRVAGADRTRGSSPRPSPRARRAPPQSGASAPGRSPDPNAPAPTASATAAVEPCNRSRRRAVGGPGDASRQRLDATCRPAGPSTTSPPGTSSAATSATSPRPSRHLSAPRPFAKLADILGVEDDYPELHAEARRSSRCRSSS